MADLRVTPPSLATMSIKELEHKLVEVTIEEKTTPALATSPARASAAHLRRFAILSRITSEESLFPDHGIDAQKTMALTGAKAYVLKSLLSLENPLKFITTAFFEYLVDMALWKLVSTFSQDHGVPPPETNLDANCSVCREGRLEAGIPVQVHQEQGRLRRSLVHHPSRLALQRLSPFGHVNSVVQNGVRDVEPWRGHHRGQKGVFDPRHRL